MERFWNKVNKSDGCWLWDASTKGNGYGQFRIDGKTKWAHRVAYELAVGDIPDGMHVMHLCDNPLCCRPDHLAVGTRKQNMEDMVKKSRQSHGGHRPLARLTENQVARIRMLLGIFSQREIAVMFDVSRGAVKSIASGKNWAYLSQHRPGWYGL